MSDYKIYCHSRLCLALKTYESGCSCHKIEYQENVKYLGVYLDNKFKMKEHVYTLCKKIRIIKYKIDKINIEKLPLETKKIIYFSLIDSLLRYGVTLYTYAPNYALDPLCRLQKRIKRLLFGEKKTNIACLTPEELSIFVLISTNFHEEKYRQINEHPYDLRVQRYRRPHVYTIQYGDRRLKYIIPTLLNNYCQDFLYENNKTKIKINIKKSILAKRR
ncbi:hypothetical protein WDU94_012176 [Cyamophila willieti]